MLSADIERRGQFQRLSDRIARQCKRLKWHSDLAAETLALFGRHWLTSTTPFPEAAQASGLSGAIARETVPDAGSTQR